MGDQVLAILIKASLLFPYAWVYEYRLFEPSTVGAWVLGMLGVDFTYYWYHRFCHRVNFAWGTHVVHHQSEEYNLAVALRQSWFGKFFHWIFDLPLALLGVPPAIYATAWSINLLYQFWIHTRAIGKLGPVEWIFNTPSHHRVHHGCNARYLDSNYAGILIIWDRMFGSFKPEQDEPVYGTVKPLASWNPLWANVQYFFHLASEARATPRAWDKLKVWFAPPEWRSSALPPHPEVTDADLQARPGTTPMRRQPPTPTSSSSSSSWPSA